MLLTRRPSASPAGRVRRWIRQRPLAAAVLVSGAGAEMLVLPFLGTPAAILRPGVADAAGLGVSLPLFLAGFVLLRFPQLRTLAGVAAAALAVLALITCNLGGLLIGSVAGMVGGSLAFAWTPPHAPLPPTTAAAEDRAAPAHRGLPHQTSHQRETPPCPAP
ncbi:DUF6114 domain-containing protein [Streptomyces sp. NL15-2K]|uniref:DUF6114 domain-containing protein n=1 Tax=Streptomyces sp. NL15-2K TaxID=376149 RepID=UPI000FFAF1B8|nr:MULTISPECIES: DUF6114 domain-containing protein [Actinomycetes]WKX15955.1 DUF6114 domain-containing protein [Kutzneria buriramensis]GCB53587.1 hypothetical protein SNL152K_10944 [Streptomyces sp. NL15-2K]